MKTCDYCLKPFESKREDATTCSASCRKGLSRRKARQALAEDGDPSVEYVPPAQEPQKVEVPQPEGTRTEVTIATPFFVEPSIKPRVKLPLSETPLRADVNSLARQVIANMSRKKPQTELELLERSQLKK